MSDNISCQADVTRISQGNMQYNVINLCPNYTSSEREAVKAKIEKQLFAVFSKYAE